MAGATSSGLHLPGAEPGCTALGFAGWIPLLLPGAPLSIPQPLGSRSSREVPPRQG